MADAKEILVQFFKKYEKKGHSEGELRALAIKKGYDRGVIESALRELKAPKPIVPTINLQGINFIDLIRKYKLYIGLSITVLIVLLVIAIFSIPEGIENCKFDKECFIEIATDCNEATLSQDVEGSTVKYTSTNECTLIINIEKFADDEPPEIRTLFEDREMTCEYDEFNPAWVDHFMNSFEFCEGDLKIAIEELIIVRAQIEAEEAIAAEEDALVESEAEGRFI